MKAQDYRKGAAKVQGKDVILDVTLPSGMVWKMREPPIEQFILSGKLPAALVVKMSAAARESDGDMDEAGKKILEQLSAEDILSNLVFGRDLLVYCAVEPRISLNPQSEDEIAPEEILPDDFMFLINWAMSGGKAGESLETFRSE